MAESTITKDQVLDWVRQATMLDIAGLVKDIETEFGVTAAAPVMAVVAGEGRRPPRSKSRLSSMSS